MNQKKKSEGSGETEKPLTYSADIDDTQADRAGKAEENSELEREIVVLGERKHVRERNSFYL